MEEFKIRVQNSVSVVSTEHPQHVFAHGLLSLLRRADWIRRANLSHESTHFPSHLTDHVETEAIWYFASLFCRSSL